MRKPINGEPYCKKDNFNKILDASEIATLSPILASIVFSNVIILSLSEQGEHRKRIPQSLQSSVESIIILAKLLSIWIIEPVSDT